jgi:hypothetical protein
MIASLPVPVTPVATTARLIPMPIFFNNAPLSLLAVMLFPDDLTLARKAVAHLLSHGTLQNALGAGLQLDGRYLTAILDDLKDGQPDQRLVGRRRYWASACGQIVKVLFALINSNDERVRERASWEAAVKIAEREIGRTVRRSGSTSSLQVHLHRFRPVLHIAGAYELAREETSRPPLTAEALMLNSMTLYEHLCSWARCAAPAAAVEAICSMAMCSGNGATTTPTTASQTSATHSTAWCRTAKEGDQSVECTTRGYKVPQKWLCSIFPHAGKA